MTTTNFDHRLSVRIPDDLIARLNRECDRTNTCISDVVRASLVEHLSRLEAPRR